MDLYDLYPECDACTKTTRKERDINRAIREADIKTIATLEAALSDLQVKFEQARTDLKAMKKERDDLDESTRKDWGRSSRRRMNPADK